MALYALKIRSFFSLVYIHIRKAICQNYAQTTVGMLAVAMETLTNKVNLHCFTVLGVSNATRFQYHTTHGPNKTIWHSENYIKIVMISHYLLAIPWQHQMHNYSFKHAFKYDGVLSLIKSFKFSYIWRPNIVLIDPGPFAFPEV